MDTPAVRGAGRGFDIIQPKVAARTGRLAACLVGENGIYGLA